MKAVIFDMDGVIVDSEPLWQKAEREVFSSLGVEVSDELCQITKSMTTSEVAKFWFSRFPWKGVTLTGAEEMVVDRVITLITTHQCIIPGIQDLVENLKLAGFKLGLATNSPYKIIPEVLKKANLSTTFDVISSAEFEQQGKPAPDVYLSTLKKLNIKAANSIAIEDSNSGIIAAKKAGMKVFAFTNRHQNQILEQVDFAIPTFDKIDLKIFN